MSSVAKDEIDQLIAVLTEMRDSASYLASLEDVAQSCISALKAGNKIIWAGNGGSAADSQHLAAELVSRFNFDRPGLASVALTTDTSALTAIGNDYGFERLFARQIEAIGVSGDVFIGISTSGRSANVIEGFKAAREKGITTVAFASRSGGDMPQYADLMINIPSDRTPKIQEGHITTGHILCSLIETALFPEYVPQSS